jgi:beta-N-acetylhexosaminidase
MAAVAKHFPGHGGVVGDSHLVLPEDHRPYSELSEDMRPYESLIEDGLRGIMMAHIRYTEVDDHIASLSPYWMRKVLRQEMGFRGAIFSVDLSMEGANVGGSVGDRAALALTAGADMILVCNNRPAVIEVLAAVKDYNEPASRGRLAAMRADKARYSAAPYGSADWSAAVARLSAALERPVLTLNG